ncbi:MAG TPA: sulfatase [Tepidisphaeraceae bacterium]|nr:sulfatase [Tepidisphaeraceae bacterium]
MKSKALWLALCAVMAFAGATSAQTKKPNIIYVLADDLGWTDVACYGSKYYETPNIDRLASQGMRFTNGYAAAPNCQPSRAALLSGQYEPRTGVYTVGNINRFAWETRPLRPVDNVTQLPLDKITIANTLKNNGYATAMFGKWHLGNDPAHLPDKRGFDEFIESSGRHFDFDTTPKVDYPKGTYLADFLTDKSIDFIQRHKDGPFFLYLPHFGVHAPHQAKAELIEKFKKKAGVGGHNNPVYAAMIYSVDESVGRIMKTLDDLGIADNTLLIFTSDNGGVGGYVREGIKKAGDVTDNAPLRGGKGMLYEGGVREPFIFRFPGKIAAGTVWDEPIINIDMYPTFLELTGSKAPENYKLDGVSLMSLLTSKGDAKLGREAIYWHFPGYLGAGENSWRTTPAGAIRIGDFKLIEFFEDGKLELYNLKDDIGQTHDLSKELPDVTKKLHDKLVAWRQETGAKMPTKNENILKEAPARKGKKKKAAAEEG